MRNITQGEIASMASALESTFSTTAQIQRRTSVSDGAGGSTDTFTDAELVKCFFYGSAGGNSENRLPTDRVEVNENWIFMFPSKTNLKHGDRIKVGTRIFEVGSISGPSSRDVVLTVGANEIT